ncbi:glycerophosphodiester phosphodiesterase domain-containing protein 5 isoform X1 [Tachysurus fulvidraco]|uniref:glycerophosphodiester phosphodiesterase domain-containing protein 5 isoform X1 n=1 Tax=Tachysurus fulvidraco TaxID=1234273 RepID=UPI001FEE6097|nr:glycerophosphodiester phosphodiesterase domain-containing protein 5 isoform X1 [Tachysurus fulvidraco]XP_027014205.2 glycerophosphodiester phosphodiesterase domain-containing protein 5 isoform X1 [Tachysurus fulvidraco]XP_047660533.1 glycerophosphodiester phosphodiesterase domain-containing protein 5 isoform X1 [Tachysurus fulvidraco]
MVKHQPLQVYERQLCLSCLTGIYGCRWKRYQRSHDDSSKWECSWFLILCSSFLLLLVWTYFWWEAQNDYNEFNWLLYNRSGEWSDGTVPILATTLVGFSYTAFLMILGLCHIALGQQLNLYWIHKIGVLSILLITITGVVSIDDIWRDEWDVILISLQSTGPFLHVGAVALMTALGWIVASQVVRGERTRFQLLLLLLYVCVLLALYLTPLTISSPCIMNRSNLKPRPAIVGRRGAPMLAPENTIMSFNKALQQRVSGFEADVTISADGVAFLMRDRTLRRTTDVARVFPQRQHDDASLFTWSEIRSLNAGLWFLRDDPYWTTHSMSIKERGRAANQTVSSLVELLRLAAKTNRSVTFSLRRPPPQHPRHELWVSDALKAVQRSGIQSEQVMWMTDWYRKKVRSAVPMLEQMVEEKVSAEENKERGIRTVSIHYSQVTPAEIRRLRARNVSVNVSPVNEPWLYSVLWCSGVQSVSSDAPHILRQVPQPIWLMSPDEYCLIWIMTDLISAAIVIGIFIFQNFHFIRWRMSGMRSYNPEQIMLSAVVRRPSRDVNIMKEKLIFSEINNGISSADELPLYTEHGYEGYARNTISR